MKELQDILAMADTRPADSWVLATLVRVRGSSYRRPGARLLWHPASHCGSVSGGCLETDLAEHARSVLASGRPRLVTYDTTSENDLVWGAGLGCHGVLDVLLEPLVGADPLFCFLRASFARGSSAIVATLFAPEGELPLGSLLALSSDGRTWLRDTAPAASQAALLQAGAEALAAGQHTAAEVEIAGGMQVFFSWVPPPLSLTLFGAGDDAIPLVRLAKTLGWHATVVDHRPAFATRERFPEAHAVVVAGAGELARAVALSDDSAAVIMTHHYHQDLAALRLLLPRPLRYLGLLGPRQRADLLLEALAVEGIAAHAGTLSRLHAPVGLALGAESPEEIALAIAAEIQARLAGVEPGFLRDRTGPIHPPVASAPAALQS